jgi:hypothetical protein
VPELLGLALEKLLQKFARDIIWLKGNPISSTTLQDIQKIVDLQFQ